MNPDEKSPRMLAVARVTVFVCLVLLPLAPLATRLGLLPWQLGLPLTALAVVTSAVLLLLLPALLLGRRFRPFAARIGVLGVLAAIPLAIGAFVVLPARDLPAIHDISTDIADPPLFGEQTLALRGRDSNPLARGAEVDAAQRAAYPALAGIDSALAPAAALERARQLAGDLGWEVNASDPLAGLLEASETTFWFGFVDDVAVRVRPAGTGSRIDLRSVSRVGRGDLGANTARIERFRAAWRAGEAGSGG